MGEDDIRGEWLRCHHSVAYFIHNYGQIYDAVSARWTPFRLWTAQYRVLQLLTVNRLMVILKARQLGLTWLLLGYILWRMKFYPAQTALLFSRREDEAVYLLRKRLRVMDQQLPEWLREEKPLSDSQHEWQMQNGSIAYAFPTTAGDSYTASLVLVDEADLVPDLAMLMNAVKPTIDAGGQMVLLSRANKDEPQSPFKRYYRAAKAGENDWKDVFLPWWERSDRTQEWYEQQKIDILTRTGSLDDLWQQYPATDAEALAPPTMSKRIPAQWLEECYIEAKGLKLADAPALPGMRIYREPLPQSRYVMGVDPAEGNPTSDDSCVEVLDEITGEEIAIVSGKFQPTAFAGYVRDLARYFNRARVLVERNNHGHTVIAWLKENAPELTLLRGQDGAVGWQTTGKSKAQEYTIAAEVFRDATATIHTFETFMQLASIDGSTLKAPKKEFDDKAVAFVLALQAIHMPQYMTVAYDYVQ